MAILLAQFARILALMLTSYLIGSIPWAYLVARAARGIDIRIEGEGNVGARNVFHVVGPSFGILVGALDVSKGIMAFLLAHRFAPSELSFWSMGVAVVAGHAFPVFLGGRGGKGASTALGFLVGRFPLSVISGMVVAGALFIFKRSFHFSFSIGMATIPLIFMPLFRSSLWEILATISFLLLLGIKRLIDDAYMKEVRAKSGWKWG
ncbi:MAG: glycerol-3-phosphate acyltransferase [bacterium]